MDEEQGEQCCNKIVTFIRDTLNMDGVEIAINRAHRLGPQRADKKRPIIASFVNDQVKEEVFEKAKEICKRPTIKVYLTRDYPKAINEARKDLGQKLGLARKQGKKGYIGFPAKLVIEGTVVEDKFPGWNDNTSKSYAEITRNATAPDLRA